MTYDYYGTPFRPPGPEGWVLPKPDTYAPFFVKTGIDYYQENAINYTNVLQPDGVTLDTFYQRQSTDSCLDMDECGTQSGCPHRPWIGCEKGDYNVTHPWSGNITSSLKHKSVCSDYGYKNVQAKKVWHGSIGFLPESCPDTYCNENNTYVEWKNINLTPPQTKYCTATREASYAENYNYENYIFNEDTQQYDRVYYFNIDYRKTRSAGLNRTIEVNKNSGEFTDTFVINQTNTDTCLQPFTIYWKGGDGTDVFATGTEGYFTSSYISQSVGWKEYVYTNIGQDKYGDWSYDPVKNYNIFILTGEGDFNPTCNSDPNLGQSAIGIWEHFFGEIPRPVFKNNGWTYDSGYVSTYFPGNTQLISDVNRIQINITRTNTAYECGINLYLKAYEPGPVTSEYTVSYSFVINLTNPYTSEAVVSTIDSMLNNWKLDNDILYPWRQDGWCQFAPLVIKKEMGSEVSPLNVVWNPFVQDLRNSLTDENGNVPYSLSGSSVQLGPATSDINSRYPNNPSWIPTYGDPVNWIPTFELMNNFDQDSRCFQWTTGTPSTQDANEISIINDGSNHGLPITQSIATGSLSGSTVYVNSGIFDPYYEKWEYTDCSGFYGSKAWRRESYGEFNTGQNGIPKTATHWTNNFEANNFTLGSWTIGLGDVVWRQKWCELKINYPSWDFNRPHTSDLFVPDYSTITSGAVTSSATVITLYNCPETTIPLSFSVAPTTSDIWGGTYVNGFYEIDNVTGTGTVGDPFILTLGDKNMFCPTFFTTSFCRLKYKKKVYPVGMDEIFPISLEPVSVTYNTSSDVSTITFNHDLIYFSQSCMTDFYNGIYNSASSYVPYQLLHENMEIFKSGSSDSICLISGNHSDVKFITGQNCDPEWYDSRTKGQCVMFDFSLDNRTNAEISRYTSIQDCYGNYLTTTASSNTGYDVFQATQIQWTTSSYFGKAIICPKESIYSGLAKRNECERYVLAVSNNGEVFLNNGITYPFRDISLDNLYGTFQQQYFVQSMIALDNQIPVDWCTPNVQLKQDDGTCKPDVDSESEVIHYYKYPNQVEPFLSLPTTQRFDGLTTARNPKTRLFNDWTISSPVSASNSQTVYIIGSGGYTYEYFTPWVLKKNVCNNLTNCRFASDYLYLCPEFGPII